MTMAGNAHDDGRNGFTLVEVSLAVLVVALGILTVFALFPSGLRSAEDEVADTRAGLFAETVFSRMRGGVDELTLWSEWSSAATFQAEALQARNPTWELDLVADGTLQTVEFPKGSGQMLRYRLTFVDAANTTHYPVKLEVCDGQYGPFQYQSVFYTEFLYKGM
jgi:prepilin-type N-terminal cleavage/methylation domain-containing protein